MNFSISGFLINFPILAFTGLLMHILSIVLYMLKKSKKIKKTK